MFRAKCNAHNFHGKSLLTRLFIEHPNITCSRIQFPLQTMQISAHHQVTLIKHTLIDLGFQSLHHLVEKWIPSG